MNITRFTLDRPKVVLTLLFIVVAGGLFSFRDMPQAEDPGYKVRMALVATYFPGASPQRVEQLVTDKLEKAIQEMPELDYMKSESKTGVSIIYVNIKENYKNLRPIWDSLRRKVDRARSDLPEGIYGPYVNDEFGDVFGIVLTITGDGFSYAELKKSADEIREELLKLSEVAKVEIYGAQDERVFVEFDNARLSAFNISPLFLTQTLESRNIIIPGGDIRIGDERIALEPSGNFESVDDLKNMVIAVPGRKELVKLGDLAHIYRGYREPVQKLMRANGVPCLGLAISLREGGNIITLGKQVGLLIPRLKESYPVGIEFDTVCFQPTDVSRKVNNFIRNLIEAVLIVILVMLVSLGLRTGLLVSVLIPVTILMTIFFMSRFNIGIDTVSLGALLIALGMLVDCAIVVSESIMVQMSEGKRAVQAAIDSARELGRPLLTSTLIISAAFLPIFLAKSAVGEYTQPIFKVVAITLLSAWVLSMTLMPLLCVRYLRVKPELGGVYETRFYKGYRALLIALLRHAKTTLLALLAVFALAVAAFIYIIPQSFFPPGDSPQFTVELELPNGSSIERTSEITTQIDSFIASELKTGQRRKEGVTTWADFIGNGGPRFNLRYTPEPMKTEYAFLIVNATSRKIVDTLIPKLEDYCARTIPDLKVTAKLIAYGPPIKNPIAFRLSGKDTDRVFGMAEKLKSQLRAIPGTRDVQDDWGARSKKLLVKIDQDRARLAGLTSRDIAVSLQTLLSGIDGTRYREDDKVIPVTIRSVASDRTDINRVESLNVYSLMTGKSVPLKQVADIEVVWEPAKILRRDATRTVTVECNLDPNIHASAVNAIVVPWLEKESHSWGWGYSWEIGGEAEKSAESNRSIYGNLPIVGLLVLLLLVIQFNSFRKPAVLLMLIPMGIIGVAIGLIVTRCYFGFMTLLGVVSLTGILINNGNVLLDRIRLEMENGHDPARALVEAGQRRLRPIFLTAGCTIAGLIPLWFGGGPLWEPMAIAIIFGLLFATLLTLCVLPVLYAVFHRISYKNFRY